MKSTAQGRRVPWALALAALLLAAGLEAQERRPGGEPDSPHAIHLRSGTFVPAPGVEPELREAVRRAARPSIGLVQLEEVPDEAVRAQLERAGVELLDYIPNNTWIARLPADVDRVASVITVRWVGRLLPEDKLAPELARALVEKAGKADLIVDVEAFEGAADEAASRVVALGGRILTRDDALSVLRVELPRNAVRSLAGSDAVRWLSPDLPKAPFNNRSRISSRANEAQAAPYGLNGAGVQLGIWDGGVIFGHTDFGARLTVVEPGAVDAHATHVAGTMAGSGARSAVFGFPPLHFRGYSTSAAIIGYDFTSATAPYSEHNGAINVHGIDNSQNSWGYIVSTANGTCALAGNYILDSREYDRIITGLFGRRIPVVFAAGNDRDDGDCGMSAVPPFLNYSIVAPPATAKNVVSVGAIHGDDTVAPMTPFSSWGPTDDGRIKPDLVAPGCNNTANPVAAIASTSVTNGYAATCGTSMAAPAVSGSIGLLLQRYRTVCPAPAADPLPSTVKALLIHTARDLDDATSYLNRGPDYAAGYGALDIQAAVDMLPFHREDQVGHGQVDNFQITVTRQSDLKVTLVWDDAAAAAGAGITLVNNLDLQLIDPLGAIHRPWLLNPLAPANNATRGADNRNVVEQVVVDNVTAANAGVWTLRVTGTNVPSGPQRYSLVTQHLRHADLSCQGAPAGDAWIMDKDAPLAPVDTGAEPNPDAGPMWISNQIWVRHNPDNVMAHQNPDFGNDNFIYARIRNRGATPLHTVRVMVYFANASLGLSWPRDWTLIGERTVVNLAAGAARVIQPLLWRPPATGHFCLYVRLLSDQDSITFPEGLGVQVNTRNNNEIAWRNVNVVNVLAPFAAAKAAVGGTGGTTQQLLIANTLDGDAELEINFHMAPDELGLTLFDFAAVTVRLSEEILAYLSEQGISLEGDGGFEKIDDQTFRMVAPTAFFSPIPVSGPRELPLFVDIAPFGNEAPSGVYTLDVNQNFPPVSGSGTGTAAAIPFDPNDPNVGGVRYDVFVAAGTGGVQGLVTDQDGAPLPGVTVRIGRDDPREAVTGEDGQFLFEGLGAGPWGLNAVLAGFESDATIVNVPSGGTVTVNLVLTAEPTESDEGAQ